MRPAERVNCRVLDILESVQEMGGEYVHTQGHTETTAQALHGLIEGACDHLLEVCRGTHAREVCNIARRWKSNAAAIVTARGHTPATSAALWKSVQYETSEVLYVLPASKGWFSIV